MIDVGLVCRMGCSKSVNTKGGGLSHQGAVMDLKNGSTGRPNSRISL